MTSSTSTAVTFARIPPRRATSRAATWWGRAWVRAVEEAAYGESDLHAARALSRSGGIGGITIDHGSIVAACRSLPSAKARSTSALTTGDGYVGLNLIPRRDGYVGGIDHFGIVDPHIAPSDHFLEVWKHYGITEDGIARSIASRNP